VQKVKASVGFEAAIRRLRREREEKKKNSKTANWRKGWDLNPRYGYPYA
jgi:hypothetical protein